MRDRVEGFREVEENEKGKLADVGGMADVVEHP